MEEYLVFDSCTIRDGISDILYRGISGLERIPDGRISNAINDINLLNKNFQDLVVIDESRKEIIRRNRK